MKILITLLLFLNAISQCSSQTFSSLVAFVFDKDSNLPISGASVIIKEAGWASKITGSDGKVLFDKSMPIGEVNYIISKEGYQGQEGKINITTEEKSNTLEIKLTKFQDDKLLITGEVVDENDKDLAGATVEVKIANIVNTTTSDQSGNYSIELTLNRTKYDVSTIKLEAKSTNGACKKTETIDLTRRNVIYKDFKLDCAIKEPKKRILAITGTVKNEQDEVLAGTLIRIKVGTMAREVRADNFGNYSIDVILDDNSYAITSIKVEAQYNQCKKTENVDIADKNIIDKDFNLACPEEAVVQKKEEDVVLDPTIEKIKEDLLGKEMPGWVFVLSQEFKKAEIINVIKGVKRLEYRVKLLLEDYKNLELRESELVVIYNFDDVQKEWIYKNHEMLYTTKEIEIPNDRWIKMYHIRDCRMSWHDTYKLVWKIPDSEEKLYSGPDVPSIKLTAASYYRVSSREDKVVKVKFTFRPD